MKAPQRIHKPPTEPHEGWIVEDIFGERYFVYKGDWQNSRATYRWWIDQPRFAFEPASNNPIHCEDTREACFRKIQEWEDLKVKKVQSKGVPLSYATSTADNKVPT
jgi:hypothetical protein